MRTGLAAHRVRVRRARLANEMAAPADSTGLLARKMQEHHAACGDHLMVGTLMADEESGAAARYLWCPTCRRRYMFRSGDFGVSWEEIRGEVEIPGEEEAGS